MINEIYGVYDDATEAFVQFVPCLNERVAQMTFTKLFNEKRLNIPMVYDYPNTFTVYKIATFDDNKGLFENLEHHQMLLNFGSFVNDSSSIS